MSKQNEYNNMNEVIFKKKTKEDIHSSMNSFCNKLTKRELTIEEFVKTIIHRLNAHIEYNTSISSKRIITEVRNEFERRSSNRQLLDKLENEKRYWLILIAKDCIGKIIEELSSEEESMDNGREI